VDVRPRGPAREVTDGLCRGREGRLPEVYRLPVILVCSGGPQPGGSGRTTWWTPGQVKGPAGEGQEAAARAAGEAVAHPAGSPGSGRTDARGGKGQGCWPHWWRPLPELRSAVRAGYVPGASQVVAVPRLRDRSRTATVDELAGGALPAAGVGKVWFAVLLALALGAGRPGRRPYCRRRSRRGRPPVEAHTQRPAWRAAEGGHGQADSRRPARRPLPPGPSPAWGRCAFRGIRARLAFTPNGQGLAATTGPAGSQVTVWTPRRGTCSEEWLAGPP